MRGADPVIFTLLRRSTGPPSRTPTISCGGGIRVKGEFSSMAIQAANINVRALERIYNIVLGDSEHATLCGEGAEKELGCCYLGLSSVRQSSPNAAASEFLPSLSRRRTCFDIIPANTIKSVRRFKAARLIRVLRLLDKDRNISIHRSIPRHVAEDR
ncbi:hypothetical protein VTN96DRAFT_7471 [Rasamsonia emersonii]